MELGEKLKLLRERAGERRGLGRALSQSEVARAIRLELGGSLSQSYLSQLEHGQRLHLTQKSRDHLARFFDVHPGYLVSDPVLLDSEAARRAAPVEPGSHGYDLAQHASWFAHAPFVPAHPAAHQTLARLAVHPRQGQIWQMLDHLIDLPDEDLHDLHHRLGRRQLDRGEHGTDNVNATTLFKG